MSILNPTLLETVESNVTGWHYIYNSNFETINFYLSKFQVMWNSELYSLEDGDMIAYDANLGEWSKVIKINDAVINALDSSGDGIIDFSYLYNDGYKEVSSDTLLSISDYFIIVDATNGNVTITLPSNSPVGKKFVIKRKDSSVNTVTIVTENGSSIDSYSSYSLSSQYSVLSVIFSGYQYYII